MRRLLLSLRLLTVAAFLVPGLACVAAVPPTIPFQGVLASTTNVPKAAGMYSVTFRLYDSATAGTLLWTEANKAVTVMGTKGLFSTTLGTPSPFSAINFSVPYYLEVQLAGDPPMTPRLPLQSVPYALTAASVPSGSITADDLAGGISVSKLDTALQQTLGGFSFGPGLFGGTPYDYSSLSANPPTPRDIAVSGNAVCVLASDDTLLVYDASQPLQPVYRTSLPTDSQPVRVVMAGGYAYTLNSDSSLRVYDLRNTSAPVRGNRVALGLTSPRDMAASESRLYVLGDNVMYVFSLADPANPALTGGYYGNQTPRYVVAQGNTAYVATYYGSTDGTPNLLPKVVIVDASNPANPTVAGSFETFSDVNAIAVAGQYVHVSYQVNRGTARWDVSNPAAPVQSGGYYNGATDAKLGTDGQTVFALSPSAATLMAQPVPPPSSVNALPSAGTRPNPAAVTAQNGYVYVASPGFKLIQAFEYHAVATAANRMLVKGGLNVEGNEPYPVTLANGDNAFGFTQAGGGVLLSTYVASQTGGSLGTVSNSNLSFYTNKSTTVMTMTPAGNVGIGTTAPAYKLDVSGIIRGTNVSPSDARLKTGVQPLSNSLSTVLGLEGVSFEWRRDNPLGLDLPAGRQIGFIAQEVEKTLPEVVSTDNRGYKSVSYQNIVPLLVEAVKEQQAQLREKDAEIEDLRRRNILLSSKQARDTAALTARLERLERLARKR